MTATKSKLMEITHEAANIAYKTYGESWPFGFAWITIQPIFKGNTKEGKAERKEIVALGFKLDYTGKSFQFYNPSRHMCQNMDTKYAGAIAGADYLIANGFKAYAENRMD